MTILQMAETLIISIAVSINLRHEKFMFTRKGQDFPRMRTNLQD